MKIENAQFVRSIGSVEQVAGDGAPEVAFVGRSNVGKSSLLNRLLGRKLARISSTPGRTRTVNWFRIDERYWFVDLPGYGFARASREERAKWAEVVAEYLRRARGPRLVVHLVDARVGATQLDREAAEYLAGFQLERVTVATKVDRLRRGARERRLAEIASALGLTDGIRVIPVSAVSGEGVRELWKRIAEFLAGPVAAEKGKKRRGAEDGGPRLPG